MGQVADFFRLGTPKNEDQETRKRNRFTEVIMNRVHHRA